MLNCHEVTRLVSEASERNLTLPEKMSLKMHLAMCNACRNFSRQMHFLEDVMREYAGGKATKRDS